MDYVEKTIKKNYMFRGKIITVRCDDAELPDGKPCFREFIEHNGGACVLYVEDGKVLLVRQFRYPYGESVYEIPAGKLDLGEEPIKAAARELEEEIKRKKVEFTSYYEEKSGNKKVYLKELLPKDLIAFDEKIHKKETSS